MRFCERENEEACISKMKCEVPVRRFEKSFIEERVTFFGCLHGFMDTNNEQRFGLIGPSTVEDEIISSDARPMSVVMVVVYFW